MSGPFKCLAVESAGPVLSVAACNGDRLAGFEEPTARAQSRLVYTLIAKALAGTGLKLAELDCVAFGCGPGGFTGLRVSAAVAQALAYGASLPVCRVSSLAVLAQGAARRHAAQRIAATLDARMGEVYCGVYDVGPDQLRCDVADSLIVPSAVAQARFGAGKFFGAGPGFAAYPELVEGLGDQLSGVDGTLLPEARDLLVLAKRCFAAGETVTATQAIPNYVRDQVARVPRKSAESR